ncbi:hypothetical protein [Cognatishimia sp.]|uniref:hypothetical protein n=1 Tax=Cognatishimia sp. TaxID=2211648 RepID=UPI003511E563
MDPKVAPQQEKKPAEAPAPNVHVLNASEVQKRSYTAQRRRRRLTLASFVLLVLAPLAAVIYYYTTLAADRYAVETKFAIRSVSGAAPTDFLGIVSSVSSATSTTSDSYIVVDFIESRDLVDRLNERLDLVAIYNHPNADVLTRLDPEKSIEDVVSYLQRMVSVYYDTSSQIITLKVQAFTPEDATRVSAAILEICDALVNEISERERQDAMRSAEKELARVEVKLDEHRKALTAFRQSQQDIDPAASAGAQIQLLGELEGRLADAQARLASLTGFLDSDAPSVRILQSQISAIEQQLETQRNRLGSGLTSTSDTGDNTSGIGNDTLTERVGTYEDLAVDLQFLQQAYVTALTSREAARIEADRAQRYLTAFVKPAVPERSLYPKRVQNILIFAGFALMLWGIAVMIVYVIREHSS